ncbi:MAG: hypothetical protein IH630_01510 [Thermoplasmata archaeon]|nr:hypothetical protein [Thermoplasmata archaeon]TFG68075.1 MAG: hypothetical protein E4H25_06515 [Methanomassiliicoccus sp.]
MTRKNRVSDAVWTSFTEALRFVIVPLILVDLVTNNYPQLSTTFMPNIEMFVVFFGGMIVASSTLEAIHRPGTYKRMLFGITALIFVCMWLFIIFGGGIAQFYFGPYFVEFDMTKIVYVILFGISLKSLLIMMTFTTSRNAEIERARKHRVELAKKRQDETAMHARVVRKASATPRHGAFERLIQAEFDVTADDEVGFTSGPHPRDLPKGIKVCEVCGVQSPTKDYVCKNCGAWFPKDTVI